MVNLVSGRLIIGLAGGAVAGYLIRQQRFQQELGNLEAMRTRLLEEAEKQARDIVLTAKDETLKTRQEVEAELEGRNQQLRREEDRLQKRREQLDSRQDKIDQREQQLSKRQSMMDKRWNQLQKMEEEQLEELQRIANLSQEEARSLLLEQVAEGTRQDMARSSVKRSCAPVKRQISALARSSRPPSSAWPLSRWRSSPPRPWRFPTMSSRAGSSGAVGATSGSSSKRLASMSSSMTRLN